MFVCYVNGILVYIFFSLALVNEYFFMVEYNFVLRGLMFILINQFFVVSLILCKCVLCKPVSH